MLAVVLICMHMPCAVCCSLSHPVTINCSMICSLSLSNVQSPVMEVLHPRSDVHLGEQTATCQHGVWASQDSSNPWSAGSWKLRSCGTHEWGPDSLQAAQHGARVGLRQCC